MRSVKKIKPKMVVLKKLLRLQMTSLLFMMMKLLMSHIKSSLVIDSCASICATSQKDFFTCYTSSEFGSVRMGNDGVVKAVGMRDVCLETNNGNTLVLKNVKHNPDIRMNLIFTCKLDDERFCNTFRNSQWKLIKGSMVVVKGKKCSSLYVMQAKIVDSITNAVESEGVVELWHNKLSHMSEKCLMMLEKKNLFSRLSKGGAFIAL